MADYKKFLESLHYDEKFVRRIQSLIDADILAKPQGRLVSNLSFALGVGWATKGKIGYYTYAGKFLEFEQKDDKLIVKEWLGDKLVGEYELGDI